MRGNAEKTSYFNPLSETQPWHEAFRELGLVKMNASDFGVSRVKVSAKTDLYSAPVLEKLRSRL